MRKLRHAALGLCLCALEPTLARAEAGRTHAGRSEPVDVDTAEQLLQALDYEKANVVAAQILRQRNLTHEQLKRSYRILAITYAVLDKDELARQAFSTLLAIEPDFVVDTKLGPKVSTPFAEARAQFRSLTTRPGLEVMPSVRDVGGQLRVIARDPTRLAKRMNVGWRWSSGQPYAVTSLPVGEAAVEVSAAPEGRSRLDYYAVALDDRDNVIFEVGNPQVPKTLFAEAIARASPKRTTDRADAEASKGSGVFWFIASAVVIGGGAAAFFALRPEPSPTRAILTPQLRCGSSPCL